MGVSKPKVGSVLSDPDSGLSAVVINRGTPVDAIRSMWEAWHGAAEGDSPETFTYSTWRMHSAQQMREDDHDCDTYWSSEGECLTSIDVAIPVKGA